MAAGGPAGQTGVLFAAPGIGRLGAPLGNQVDHSVGGAIGHQMFFADSRRQLLLEIGGRVGLNENSSGSDQTGFAASYQMAMFRRWVWVVQGFGSYNFDLEDFAISGRFELQLRL